MPIIIIKLMLVTSGVTGLKNRNMLPLIMLNDIINSSYGYYNRRKGLIFLMAIGVIFVLGLACDRNTNKAYYVGGAI